jgi:Cu(I)/Ag(I) efflux system periplasmic protein CusF
MLKLQHLAAVALLALGLAGAAASADVQGAGVVKAVDAKAGTVTIAHQPIKTLGWPAMTMPFKVASPALLDKVAIGRKVQFTLVSASDPKISSLKVME